MVDDCDACTIFYSAVGQPDLLIVKRVSLLLRNVSEGGASFEG